MEFPFEERVRSYIKDRTFRLNRQILHVNLAASLGWILCVVFAFVNTEDTATYIVAAVLIYFGHAATKSNLNLHIDLLTVFKHDLDRDLAHNLAGFHTPD